MAPCGLLGCSFSPHRCQSQLRYCICSINGAVAPALCEAARMVQSSVSPSPATSRERSAASCSTASATAAFRICAPSAGRQREPA